MHNEVWGCAEILAFNTAGNFHEKTRHNVKSEFKAVGEKLSHQHLFI